MSAPKLQLNLHLKIKKAGSVALKTPSSSTNNGRRPSMNKIHRAAAPRPRYFCEAKLSQGHLKVNLFGGKYFARTLQKSQITTTTVTIGLIRFVVFEARGLSLVALRPNLLSTLEHMRKDTTRILVRQIFNKMTIAYDVLCLAYYSPALISNRKYSYICPGYDSERT